MLNIKKKKEKERQEYNKEMDEVNPMEELAQETGIVEDPEEVPKEAPKETTNEIEEDQRWVVGEIATSTEKVIHDKQSKKSYDIYSAIALILNEVTRE